MRLSGFNVSDCRFLRVTGRRSAPLAVPFQCPATGVQVCAHNTSICLLVSCLWCVCYACNFWMYILHSSFSGYTYLHATLAKECGQFRLMSVFFVKNNTAFPLTLRQLFMWCTLQGSQNMCANRLPMAVDCQFTLCTATSAFRLSPHLASGVLTNAFLQPMPA